MKTYTTLKNLGTSLSQNTSTTNDTLIGQLENDQHRYLLQKYFDNERTATTTTVGGTSLTLTGSLSIGATSATLTATWTFPTGQQYVNFSDGEQRNVLFTNGSAAISWTGGLTGTATTAIATLGFQFYNIPANVSKIKNDTINVGQLKYQPVEVKSRAEWDNINFLPYNSDIPNYYFIYNGQMGIFPIPSTTGNILTFNYKTRVPDLSYADYSTGTLATMTVGSTTVTGTATSWNTTGTFPLNTDVTFLNLYLRANPATGGDGIWYQIRQFNSNTSLTLVNPVVNAPNVTASTTYTIGQVPLLEEDFQDMIVYGALMIYFSTIVPDAEKYRQVKEEYDKRLVLLEDYAGTKSVNVDLGIDPPTTNPNLFIYANS